MFRYHVEAIRVLRDVNLARLGWPTPNRAESDSGLGGNRSYVDLRGLDWDEVQEIYVEEGELLHRIESADSPSEELEAIGEELLEELGGALGGLDLGVASSAACLAAAGCIPFSSCNGGALGDSHHETHPLVAFYATKHVVPRLLEVAKVAGVGLVGDGNYLVLYSGDVRLMRVFAKTMLSQRGNFT